jgi:DNA-binding LacI/PurR family transcriptional regulator
VKILHLEAFPCQTKSSTARNLLITNRKTITVEMFMVHDTELNSRIARKPPTIRDVAEAADVSTATVSRVLAGADQVTDELKERVFEATRRLRYTPNRVARNLRRRTTRMIGVVVPDIENPFFTSIIGGVEEVLQAANYNLLLANYNESPAKEYELLRTLGAEGAAGIIFTPSNAPDADYQDLVREPAPMVAISRYPEGLNVDVVAVANSAGARAATDHLIRLGHKTIAFINGPIGISTARERQAGYLEAFAAAGLEPQRDLIVHGEFRQDGGYHAMQALLSLDRPPTAVFTASNLMTLGALQAIHERGLRIPKQIAVVGYDDLPWATSLQPPLTAVAQPARDVGVTAARLLLDRLAEPERPTRRIILDTHLVIRASCGAEKSARFS